MVEKTIAFYDLELSNNPTEIGWNNHKKMDFACGCTHVAKYQCVDSVWEAKEIERFVFLNLNEFASHLNKQDLVVGFNSIHFDDRVITAHAGGEQDFLLKRFDIYDDLVARTKIKYITSLEKLAQTTVGQGKTDGISGKDAPQMWQEGKQKEVIAYCQQDCKILFEIFNFGVKYGYVLIPPNKNAELFGNLVLKINVDWNQKLE